MKNISFQYVLSAALNLTPKCDAETALALNTLYKITAEHVREHTHMHTWNPSISFEQDEETFKRNASRLLEQANKYFAERLKKFPAFNVATLPEPEASYVPNSRGLNYKEFRGGMLGFMKANDKQLEGIVKDYEVFALNAVTWAYHFSQHREPFTYFEVPEEEAIA